jgi:hypothetical protein
MEGTIPGKLLVPKKSGYPKTISLIERGSEEPAKRLNAKLELLGTSVGLMLVATWSSLVKRYGQERPCRGALGIHAI